MNLSTFLAISVITLFLTSCTVTGPVAVIGQNGRILRGTYTASLSGGSFQVTDGKLTCAGSYDSMDTSSTITMPVYCSDGRKGFVVSTRQPNGVDGFGKVTLNDGTHADFVFGKAAEAF